MVCRFGDHFARNCPIALSQTQYRWQKNDNHGNQEAERGQVGSRYRAPIDPNNRVQGKLNAIKQRDIENATDVIGGTL